MSINIDMIESSTVEHGPPTLGKSIAYNHCAFSEAETII